MGSAEQELGAGSFGWFPRPGSSPGPPWNAHRGADSAGRSHASGVRLSRAWSHPGAQDATVLTISELRNPEHLLGQWGFVPQPLFLAFSPTSLSPGGLGFSSGLCFEAYIQGCGAGKGMRGLLFGDLLAIALQGQ